MVDMFGNLLNVWKNLDTGGTATNYGHSLIGSVERRVIAGRVHVRSLEGMEAWDVRPLPIVQHAPAKNQDVSDVFKLLKEKLVLMQPQTS